MNWIAVQDGFSKLGNTVQTGHLKTNKKQILTNLCD